VIIHIYKDAAGRIQYRLRMREDFSADELLEIFARLIDKVMACYKKIKSHG